MFTRVMDGWLGISQSRKKGQGTPRVPDASRGAILERDVTSMMLRAERNAAKGSHVVQARRVLIVRFRCTGIESNVKKLLLQEKA